MKIKTYILLFNNFIFDGSSKNVMPRLLSVEDGETEFLRRLKDNEL
jgi:hypothetical protein